jgi:hypothetical protein
MIRIRTSFGDKRVFTLFFKGEWITLASGMEAKVATTLQEASFNHLESAKALRDRLQKL